MDAEVIDNAGLNRFELVLGDATATADYRIDGDTIILTHTNVPPALGGQGVGTRLAEGVFEAVRASGRKIVPECPFMAKFAASHPAYADLIAD